MPHHRVIVGNVGGFAIPLHPGHAPIFPIIMCGALCNVPCMSCQEQARRWFNKQNKSVGVLNGVGVNPN